MQTDSGLFFGGMVWVFLEGWGLVFFLMFVGIGARR